MNESISKLSIRSLIKESESGVIKNIAYKIVDRIIGLHSLNQLYLENNFAGLEKQQFTKKFIEIMGVTVNGAENILNLLPKKGGCVVVCNHPYGMIEGIILAQILNSKRTDTKIMANIGLKIIDELKDYFIFSNPLKPKSKINVSAIKQCFNHVDNGGVLVIFPAGRVSFHQKELGIVSDAEWNRVALKIASKFQVPVLPIFISGSNSKLFHWMGRMYYRFRLLMLVREMLKLKGHKISLKSRCLVTPKEYMAFETLRQSNEFLRAQCYFNEERNFKNWNENVLEIMPESIANKLPANILEFELARLPIEQTLLTFRNFTVYFGYHDQIPQCVKEIARLRELTFRELKEGSGKSIDTDQYDKTYTHLFIYDKKSREIIGAYRMGQTDRLMGIAFSKDSKSNKNSSSDKNIKNLYLSKMFRFNENFPIFNEPCLEMGRSFIVKEHQTSFHGLLLLWKGIGAFVCLYPQYRTLYGTVSLSKNYDMRSVAVINEVLIKNNNVVESNSVMANNRFDFKLSPEINHYLHNNISDFEQLSLLIKTLEEDNKDIPILLKQYHKLNAQFYSLAVDTSFNDTPGLLLAVHLPSAPKSLIKLYLGNKRHDYLKWCEKV